MCPIDFDDNNDTQIAGATDGTKIGNIGDRLKVDASFGTVPSVSELESPTFISVAMDVAVGFNKSMISVANSGDSGVVLKLREVRMINVQTSAATGVVASCNLYRCTSHSAGTSITPQSYDTNDSLNGGVTIRTGGTISGEVASTLRHWEWSTDEWTPGAPDVESADHLSQVLFPIIGVPSKTKPITIRPGQGITIKQETNSSVGKFDLWLLFTQESV